jgi:hypothetical protein
MGWALLAVGLLVPDRQREGSVLVLLDVLDALIGQEVTVGPLVAATR